ncbi:HAD family hydrolase [Xylophilus ampelinus]|uniref:HAD superfamily hydrolase (TIGR01509 family) n=1 Tax=Xylophilus ampelinus TaxID=54067 RepID=A0A318SU48_9BURK|nr:HAD family phosphatase [Xylophilus ampelinus]MCS4510195.1 HAD family phosphatase [Xylophilus ampelinus]PYE78187.1 HAD superfamily hydrolase (TIGR01509 family) [Xylophilus ampelinus]
MDGVLIQSRETIEDAWTRIACSYGIEVSHAFIRDHIHGRSGEYTLLTLFGEFDPVQRRRIKEQVDAIEEIAACPLVPGVATLIAQLRNGGISSALVTSSWPARIAHVLQQHDMENVFDCVISREDVERGKPAPDCYRLAAQRLSRPIHECLVFEDSVSGVQSAVRSGALCIGIGDDLTLVDHGATAVYADFESLPILQTRASHPTFDGRMLLVGINASLKSIAP